jgi:isopenicillin N synthase-like dioxygenase
MTDFYWECHENAKMILRAMAVGIGLPHEDYFLESHSGHHNQLRLLHYPPILAAQLEEKSGTRLDAHTDWGSITMVFQDDCGGLQVNSLMITFTSFEEKR